MVGTLKGTYGDTNRFYVETSDGKKYLLNCSSTISIRGLNQSSTLVDHDHTAEDAYLVNLSNGKIAYLRNCFNKVVEFDETKAALM